ncbi:MAG: beta-galactosidase trimerization domain-containing protein, partial [Clostridia bacterium]|nr:beta-galactosidase trimerization domain-containing protein [Clostridia bacterium]
TADVWCDVIDGKDTTVLAEYTDGFYKGSPCITANRYGKGFVYYIGCNMKIDELTMLYGYICDKAGVERCRLRPVPGVETVLRKGDAGEYIFAMNHTDSAVYIPIKNKLTDRISGISHTGSIRLEPYGVAVLY